MTGGYGHQIGVETYGRVLGGLKEGRLSGEWGLMRDINRQVGWSGKGPLSPQTDFPGERLALSLNPDQGREPIVSDREN